MNEQTIYLDVNKAVSPTQMVRIGQGDVAGTTINAYIYDNGAAADLTDMSARFEMRLPNSGVYVRDASCTIEGNVITYVVDEAHAASVAGITDVAYFDILDGEDVIYSTERFSIDVLRSAHDGAVPAQSWDNAVDELIERGEQAVSDAEQAVGDATSAIDAANQAIARIEPTIEQAAEDAAEQATADAEQRIQDAIDAVGDISELAVPLMTPDTRGGAKLEEHGGLALRDGALGIGSLVQESDGYARGGLTEVTAKGHAEQVTTTGKNLLPKFSSASANGLVLTAADDGSVTISGTSSALTTFISIATLSAGTYTLSGCPSGGGVGSYQLDDGGSHSDQGNGATFTVAAESTISFRIRIASGVTCNNLTFYPQLELGSTATEYEPYTGGAPSPSPDYPQEIEVVTGHTVTGKTGRFVDLEVRDANDQLLSTTPIPLPQRGWVAGLPDGTADVLRLDGAGHVEWTLRDGETTYDGSSDESWGLAAKLFYIAKTGDGVTWDSAIGLPRNGGDYDRGYMALCNAFVVNRRDTGVSLMTHRQFRIGDNGFSAHSNFLAKDTEIDTVENWTAFLTQNPVTVLYPLATPVTEDCGYVDMPEISGECQVSIPELDEVGIRYFVDSTVTELARQWYARANSEYADRLSALEQAVAELATS